MSLDCAKKYAEGKINDILNQAIIDAYSAGYNVGYQDGYKKAEKETILEEMKYVDLGLPSGTLWDQITSRKTEKFCSYHTWMLLTNSIFRQMSK